MSQKNEVIAGIVFFSFWLIVLLLWGYSKNIKPDLRGEGGYEPAKTFGHPLYNDY